MNRDIIQQCWDSLNSIEQAMGDGEITKLCEPVFDRLEQLSKEIK